MMQETDRPSVFGHENPLHCEEPHSTGSDTSEDGLVHMKDSGGQIKSLEIDEDVDVPNMWAKENRGLYMQYMAVGLLYGSAGTILPFCIYVKGGEDNVCSNAPQLVFFAWNFKILFAIVTDIYRPFGSRRKFWMITGWSLALVTLFILAVVPSDSLSVSAWMAILMLCQAFVMLSDVPADGYSVALGKMEPKSKRGQILATGQRLRFTFSMLAGFIQTFFLNSKSTSPPNCKEGFDGCWSFGLSMNGYYALLFVIVAALTWPILHLQEIKSFPRKSGIQGDTKAVIRAENGQSGTDAAGGGGDYDVSTTPQHSHEDVAPTWSYFKHEVWEILMNQTTLYLLIYVIGFQSFAGITNQANVYLQYYVIELTMFQAGIDTMTSYMALVAAIYLFQTYLLGVNWRFTQWTSSVVSLLLALLWIPAYYDSSGLMNPWFTIFIDLDRSFISGLSQVLYSLSVIELARPGLEATTYELIVTVGNACITVASIVGTQLMIPTKIIGCQDLNADNCSADSVAITGKDNFFKTDGPDRYTNYTILVFVISAVNSCIWVWFLPRSIAHCAQWQLEGEKSGNSTTRGYIAAGMCGVVMTYGFLTAFLLLDENTSCLKIVGGSGCS
jgi:hypothetical protein